MYAIVLSCDKYHPFTDHMIHSYQDVWPSHPFLFRVPYQEYPCDLKDKYGDNIELIKTKPSIKQTVLSLIEDLDDEEWVYWCLDDKYLVDVNETAVNNCFKFVSKIQNPLVCGVMFCRCRKLLDSDNLQTDNEIISNFGDVYIKRKNYYQIWIPQFIRTKIIRNLFLEFPDRPFEAKEMDVFTGQEPGLTVKDFQKHQNMYVSETNYAQFGESTSAGRVMQNCRESMTKYKITIPNLPMVPRSTLIGKM